jgi:cytochrome c553
MFNCTRRTTILPICIVASLTVSAGAWAATPIMTDQLLASQCAQCHGTYGRSVRDIESLAGKSYGSLYSDMMEMRTEGRPSEIMEHQAFGYTPQQIERIALYYSSLSESGAGSNSRSSSSDTTRRSGGSTRRTSSRRDD